MRECSLLPGHWKQKWSQNPVLVQMLNIYWNVFGWFTTDNPPFTLQLKDISNSGVSLHCFPLYFFVDWRRSPPLAFPSTPLGLEYLWAHQHLNTAPQNKTRPKKPTKNKKTLSPSETLEALFSTIRDRVSFREQVHISIVGTWASVD